MTSCSAPVVTVSAWAGSTNLGDELVLAALLDKLASRGVEPLVLSVDPAGTANTYEVGATGLIGALGRRRGAASPVLLGGGGLLQDETSPLNLPFHLGRTLLVAGPGGRFAGIGLGAGPLTGRAGRRLVRSALRRAAAVSVRDAASLDVLAGIGVAARLAADLAVSLPDPRVQVKGRVAVSLRPWTGTGSVVPVAARRRSATGDRPAWFAPAMAGALDAVAAGTGLGIHFVALQADRDDAVHRAVAERMLSPATFASPDVRTVVGEVASCEAVVAMRYHAGVAALLGGRPAVLIGYSPKVPSLAREVPGGMSGLAWDRVGLEALPRALEAVLDRGEAVVEGRARLRVREQVNDQVLDQLLEAARPT